LLACPATWPIMEAPRVPEPERPENPAVAD